MIWKPWTIVQQPGEFGEHAMPNPTAMSMKKALVVAPIVALAQQNVLVLALLITAIAPVVVLLAPPVSLLIRLIRCMTMKQRPILGGGLATTAIPVLATRRLTAPLDLDVRVRLVRLSKSHPAALATRNLLRLPLNM